VYAPSAIPASTSTIATASTEVLTGSSGTSTKPVPKVPTSAPAVAHPESTPIVVPLARRSRSCQRATVGETALSTAATGTSAANVTSSAPAVPPSRADGPSQRTTGTVSRASRPPPINKPTTKRRGLALSATHPPVAAPTAMPSSTAPMIEVVVSSVRPTYGASRRTERISSTRTAPAATKTIPAASGSGSGATTPRGRASSRGSGAEGCREMRARARDVLVLISSTYPLVDRRQYARARTGRQTRLAQ